MRSRWRRVIHNLERERRWKVDKYFHLWITLRHEPQVDSRSTDHRHSPYYYYNISLPLCQPLFHLISTLIEQALGVDIAQVLGREIGPEEWTASTLKMSDENSFPLKGMPGYSLGWGGEAEDSARAQSYIAGAIPIFFGLMVLIVIFLFNSIKKTLVIWLTVPLALIGVTAGLMKDRLGSTAAVDQRSDVIDRWKIWREEKARRLNEEEGGGVHSAAIFAALTAASRSVSAVSQSKIPFSIPGSTRTRPTTAISRPAVSRVEGPTSSGAQTSSPGAF